MSELLTRANWVDILALILILKIAYVSSRIGVGKQILPLILLLIILCISLYYYKEISDFFVGRFGFSKSICRFFSFLSIVTLFGVIYRVLARIANLFLTVGEKEEEGGGIEKIGGALFGILRSIFIVGIVMIAFLLAPIRFVENSVKNSPIATFLVRTNVRIYCNTLNIIRRESERISAKDTLAPMIHKKDYYLFGQIGLKQKARFFKDEY